MKANCLDDELLKKEQAYPYEYCILVDIDKPPNPRRTSIQHYINIKNQGEHINRAQQNYMKNDIRKGYQQTLKFSKMDVLQLANAFEHFVQKSALEEGISLLYS